MRNFCVNGLRPQSDPDAKKKMWTSHSSALFTDVIMDGGILKIIQQRKLTISSQHHNRAEEADKNKSTINSEALM